ncbi:MAG: tyrosine-type recombinase/integrase [Candidatus Limiplasma sp.]|nr:tyrosine-type recombinase/integrase [Candidatus Limiplasma sp.]
MPSRKNEAAWSETKSRWRIDVQKDGVRKSFYDSTKGRKGKIACEAKADTWLESNRADAPVLRFKALWCDFMEDVRISTGPSNYRTLDSIGRVYLLPALANKKCVDITMQDWQDIINAAYKRGLAKKTCANIRGAATALYRYARKNRVQMERPELLTIPRGAPVGERKILQPEQLKILFAVDYIMQYGQRKPCPTIHAWRFEVLSGLRRGELCGLQWDDLDGNVLHIRRSINAKNELTAGKNENARRYIALSGRMVAEIAAQRETLKRAGIIGPWIFPDPSGDMMHPNNLYRRWYIYCKQHGMSCSLHELRHTMISLVKADVPEPLLKKIVGHSEAMDTGKYEHIVDGDAQRAAKMIDAVFGRLLE